MAAILLGPLNAILVMTVVLVIQALVFFDGGLSAIGANVFNMGVTGAFLGWGTYKLLLKVLPKGKSGLLGATAVASWLSVFAAAGMAAVELGVSGTVPLNVALPAMLTALLLGEPPRHRAPSYTSTIDRALRPILDPLFEFFRRRGAWLVLLFILLHKIGDTLANLSLRLLFNDQGYSNDEIALYDVGFGFWAVLGGIFVGGLLYTRLGMHRSVLLSLVLMAVSNLSFAGLALVGHSNPLMAASMCFENFASGVGGVTVVAYFSSLCNLQFTASQYALISAAASVVGRFLAGTTTGAMIESFGYVPFYLLTTVVALPGIALYWMLYRRGIGGVAEAGGAEGTGGAEAR